MAKFVPDKRRIPLLFFYRFIWSLPALLIAIYPKVARTDGNISCRSKYDFSELADENRAAVSSLFAIIDPWIRKNNVPIFSILLSKDGHLVYEFYATLADRDTPRNIMSVTKSFTSALVGITIDNRRISSVDRPVTDYLPLPKNGRDLNKLKTVTIKNIMSMSGIAAQTWPKTSRSNRIVARNYHLSENRYEFALKQILVARPGIDFKYTDVNPALITAVLQNSNQKNLFDLANENLFRPMNYKGQRWLFRDKAGYDNSSYGLELRPIDMHKFGILYLNNGCWDGKQLLSPGWVQQSFIPQIKSDPRKTQLDYGWFWWKEELRPGWNANMAKGWHGQRLALFPEKNVVISITSNMVDDSEEKFVNKIFDFLLNAMQGLD